MSKESPPLVVGLNAVILAVTDEEPRVLTVRRSESSAKGPSRLEAIEDELWKAFDALPFGPLDPTSDRTLELTLRGWVREQTGLELGYVEQLYTFGDRHRDPRERLGGPRVLSIGYLALVREEIPSGDGLASWRPWYQLFPWEDWRHGHPAIFDRQLTSALDHWVDSAEDARLRRLRRERVDITFGMSGVRWDGERALERYELIYEAGLVAEAIRDQRALKRGDDEVSPLPHAAEPRFGRAMRFDHRRIVATALSRLRGKIKYRPVVFELLPPEFTLLQLQRVVEALAGTSLHKQNFRRLVERGGLVEGTGKLTSGTGGRPAELFRFRHEVLRERPRPGVGLPSLPMV